MTIDESWTLTPQGIARNELVITRLSRSDFMSVLSCEAVNSNLTDAATTSITLDLNRTSHSFRSSLLSSQPMNQTESVCACVCLCVQHIMPTKQKAVGPPLSFSHLIDGQSAQSIASPFTGCTQSTFLTNLRSANYLAKARFSAGLAVRFDRRRNHELPANDRRLCVPCVSSETNLRTSSSEEKETRIHIHSGIRRGCSKALNLSES